MWKKGFPFLPCLCNLILTDIKIGFVGSRPLLNLAAKIGINVYCTACLDEIYFRLKWCACGLTPTLSKRDGVFAVRTNRLGFLFERSVFVILKASKLCFVFQQLFE